MSERLDAIHGVKSKTGKTYWQKVGTAFRSKSGNGYTLYLDYLPLNRSDDGKIVLMLSEPRQKDGSPPSRSAPSRQNDMNDDVPF